MKGEQAISVGWDGAMGRLVKKSTTVASEDNGEDEAMWLLVDMFRRERLVDMLNAGATHTPLF